MSDLNIAVMSQSQLSAHLINFYSKEPLRSLRTFIVGSPGLGKSHIINELAKSLGYKVYTVILSQCSPSDLRVPYTVDNGLSVKETKFAINTSLLPKPDATKSLVFFDEMTQASGVLQKIAMSLILDGRYGDYEFPSDTIVVAAGNKTTDRAGSEHMLSALANRFAQHIELVNDTDSFINYAIENEFDPRIIGFIKFRPNLLHKMTANAMAWPSNRTWDMFNTMLKNGITDATLSLGSGVGAEFSAFSKVFGRLPEIKDILSGKNPQLVDEDSSIYYALIGALLSRVNSYDVDSYYNATKYIHENAPTEFFTLFIINSFSVVQSALYKKDKKSSVKLMSKMSEIPNLEATLKRVNSSASVKF